MNNVTIYSAPWCGGCKVVKKALEQNGFNFTEVDIGTVEGMVAAKLADVKSIPVTVVHNDFFSENVVFVGSKPETIKAILEAVVD